jgi:uncharacterized protein involved in exopolysaccharide biosynthesis
MLLVGALGAVVGVSLALIQQPRYLAKATVLLASQRVAQEFVRPTIEEDPLERVNALLGEVLSVDNLYELIEKHGLFVEERASTSRAILVGRMRRSIQMGQEVQVGTPSRFDRAQILGISFTADDPETAAAVANDLAQLFVLAGIRMRSEQARVTTEFMRRELEAAEESLREHTRKIASFQEQHRGELPSELDTQLARLERLQSLRSSLTMQIVEAETRLATIRADASRDAGSGGPSRLEQMRALLAQELAVNTETHPNVQALRRQIETLEREGGGGGRGGGATGGVVSAVQREIDQLRQQLADTDQQLIELDAKVARIPALGEEFSALQQRATVLEQTYTEYLRKVKEAELAESLERAQQGARVSVLDRASPPAAPQRSREKLAAFALIASLGLAVLVGVVLEWRDPVLASVRAVEEAGQVEVLGSIPHMG